MKKNLQKNDVDNEKKEKLSTAESIKRFENELMINALGKIALQTKKANELTVENGKILKEVLKEIKLNNELLVNLSTDIEVLVNLMNSSVEEAAQSFITAAAAGEEEEKLFSFEISPKSDKLN
jgi:cell division septal protein FtsQ